MSNGTVTTLLVLAVLTSLTSPVLVGLVTAGGATAGEASAIEVAPAVGVAPTAGGPPTAGGSPATGEPSATGIAATVEQDRGTRIDDCTTITESGRYVLTGDVRNSSPTNPQTGLGACIAVRASDVTLLGGGHTVAAGGGGQPGVVGVLVGGRERQANVTVRNLTSTGWGAGVAVFGTADAALLNVSAVGNLGDGLFVENAPGAEIRDGTISGSNTGVFVRNADGARIADLTVSENLAGISVRRSDDATVEGTNASRNRQYGAGLFSSANATVADSTVRENGFAGVALSRADDARLRNLTIAPIGVPAPGGSDPVGVYLNDSAGTRLVGVSVADAPGWAFYATGNSTAVGEQVRLDSTGLSFEVSDVALDSEDGPPPLPTERQVVGDPLFALPTGKEARLSLSVEYADSALDRVNTTEDSLSLWRFDAGEGWDRVATTIGAERNVASATFAELDENGTIVALVGEGLAESESERLGESENESRSESEDRTETVMETESETATRITSDAVS